MNAWISLCTSRPVVRRAALSALVVGTVLILINHGEAVLHGNIDGPLILRMGLTVIVPYVVSTVSSVSTLLSIRVSSD